MGTYGSVYGELDIPQERLPELTERMLKVIHVGGMMDFDCVEQYGKQLLLLKPVTFDNDQIIRFNYNYFDPLGFWELAAFNSATGEVVSNKIGTSTFNSVVMAMYTLLEFYSRKIVLARVDNQFFDATRTIGWFNHIFNTQYDAERVCHPWQVDDNGQPYHHHPNRVPVEPVSSEQFLHTTSDERAYFWREGGDVEFSPEMRRWLEELRREWLSIISCRGPAPADYVKILVECLARAGKGREPTLFFSAPFNEFLAHRDSREVQTAIVLLNRLLDGYQPGGEYLNRDGWVWTTPYSRFNNHFGAYTLKLYFAILANPELRKRMFDF